MALNSRFCSWVVQETDAEHDVTEDGKSIIGLRKSSNVSLGLPEPHFGDPANHNRASALGGQPVVEEVKMPCGELCAYGNHAAHEGCCEEVTEDIYIAAEKKD